jgi:Fe-S oxidoreductase
MIGETGYFAGGSLIGKTVVEAAADGLNMATAIDNFLKTKNLIYPKDTRSTSMCQLDSKLIYDKPVTPQNGVTYTKEEAEAEASRCIECQCDACRSHCDITEFYGKWPLRIRDEIMATTLPGSAEVKATPAKRLLSTCNQCGRCKDFCPEDVDLGGLILAGRQSMHRQGKTAWFFHDFWIRDMEFTNGEECAIKRAPKGSKSSTYAFFPGCQLSAGKPELVEMVYEFLLKKEPQMGLMLQCCGVPVEWAGDVDKHLEAINQIRKAWNDMGKPTIILACPTCSKKFKEHLPEIQTTFVYDMLEKLGMVVEEDSCKKLLGAETAGQGFSIFDSCATRNEPGIQASVRKYAEAAGCKLEALPQNGADANCCGFGGQSSICNPEFAEFVAKKRVAEGDKPYITYCINCRDAFLNEGKPSIHLLELLFKQDDSQLYYQPTITERRNNRKNLKKKLLKKYWGEEMQEKKTESSINLIISPELKEKLGKDRIIEEDLILVIEFCERTGRRIYNETKGTYSGYSEVGYMTHWVEYKPIDVKNTEAIVTEAYSGENSQATFELINAYCHRMKIELEAVWNGTKTEIDV